MGGSQSLPTTGRKGAGRTSPSGGEERAVLVLSGDESVNGSVNGDPGAIDVASTGDTSPRSVSRYPNVSPSSTGRILRSGSSTSEILHGDISALSLESNTPANDPSGAAQQPNGAGSSTDSGTFRILMLMSETGGGHRASAQALEAAFEALHPGEIEITTVDFWVNVAGFPFNNFPRQYTYLAKRPLLWKFFYHWAQFPPTRWLTESAFSVFCFAKVRKYFERHSPDLIISVHPLVNTLSLSVLQYMAAIHERPMPPYMVVVTDLGGAHPTWFDARSDLTYVPSDPLKSVALGLGLDVERVRLFGLPIRPTFWQENRSRSELRHELGMAQDIPAVLLVGGGDGVGGLGAIASAIATQIGKEVGSSGGQLIVVTGKNKKLLNQLQARSWPIPVVLKGFVNNMSEWMSACDIICSKAGPGTIAEAWIRGLPIIITGFLPGQEEGNVQLVTDSGSGEYHSKPEMIGKTAAKWVGDPELRGAIAGRARSLGRPKSSCQIAADIWNVGQSKLKDRQAWHRRRSLNPTLRPHNGFIAMGRFYANALGRTIQRSAPAVFGYHHPEEMASRD